MFRCIWNHFVDVCSVNVLSWRFFGSTCRGKFYKWISALFHIRTSGVFSNCELANISYHRCIGNLDLKWIELWIIFIHNFVIKSIRTTYGYGLHVFVNKLWSLVFNHMVRNFTAPVARPQRPSGRPHSASGTTASWQCDGRFR